MWATGSFLDKEIKYVEIKLIEALKTKNKTVENAVIQLLNSGGKRLRPAFTILGATFGEYKREDIISVATAVEIVHMATLVHDDVIDDAELRRGNETIQKKFGKDVAVYCGDFLFSRAFILLSDIAEIKLLKDIAKGVAFICDSEVMQHEQKYMRDITIRHYLRRVAGKTAALFAVGLSAGGYKAGCNDKLTKKLGRIGKNVGMAFQIVDDLLDFTGKQEAVGKPLLSDVVQGVYTLPVIYALNSKYNKRTCEALDKVNLDNGTMLLETLIESGSINKTKKLAKQYIDKAKKDTYTLPDNGFKGVILEIIDKQLERKF